jgi:hypothetical protein
VTYVTYVTVHTHTDGPIPGPHSLLTLSCASIGPSYDNAGNPDPSSPVTKTLQLNIEEIRGATIHLKHFEYWQVTNTSYHPTLCQDLPTPPCMLKSCSLSLVHPSRVRPANQG